MPSRWSSNERRRPPPCAMVPAMAARQLWAFLTPADLEGLLTRLSEREPGLVVSAGRYLRGDPKLLVRDPRGLERRESLPGERRLYLFHQKHSAEVVAHLQPEGPFEGWSQIDEERSDCLVLQTKEAPEGVLEPARLYAYVTWWRAADKARKRPMFSIWAGQTMKWVAAQLPTSGVKFVHVGEDARAQARSGKLRLTYLYREIAPG